MEGIILQSTQSWGLSIFLPFKPHAPTCLSVVDAAELHQFIQLVTRMDFADCAGA